MIDELVNQVMDDARKLLDNHCLGEKLSPKAKSNFVVFALRGLAQKLEESLCGEEIPILYDDIVVSSKGYYPDNINIKFEDNYGKLTIRYDLMNDEDKLFVLKDKSLFITVKEEMKNV